MVPLVLNDARMKGMRHKVYFLAFSVQCLNTNALVTWHLASQIGNTEAAFPITLGFFCHWRDLRIDENRQRNLWFLRIARIVRDLENRDLFCFVDLVCRQPDTVILLHRFDHVVDEFLYFGGLEL